MRTEDAELQKKKKTHKVMIIAVQTVTCVAYFFLNLLRSNDEFMWEADQT